MHTDLLFRLLFLQLLALAFSAGIGLFAGGAGLLSALIGGGCYWLASAVSALALRYQARFAHKASPFFIFQLEFFKLVFTVVLLFLCVWQYRDLVWWAFLLALVVVPSVTVFLFALPSSARVKKRVGA